MRNDKFDWFHNNRVATAKHRSVNGGKLLAVAAVRLEKYWLDS